MLRPVLVVLAVCFLCTVTRDRQVFHRADIRTVEAVQPAAVAGVQASPAHTPANATAGDIPSSNTSRRLHASPPTGRRSSQVECAAGAAGPDCRPCPSDHYSPGGSNATCQQCPPGSSSWGGARACVSGVTRSSPYTLFWLHQMVPPQAAVDCMHDTTATSCTTQAPVLVSLWLPVDH